MLNLMQIEAIEISTKININSCVAGSQDSFKVETWSHEGNGTELTKTTQSQKGALFQVSKSLMSNVDTQNAKSGNGAIYCSKIMLSW